MTHPSVKSELNQYALQLVTGVTAALEPVTLTQAKEHLSIDRSIVHHDNHIRRLITAARQRIEQMANRATITQTWDFFLDRFPSNAWAMLIPLPPLQSVTSVKYIYEDGNQQTWASSKYKVDTATMPGRITPAFGEVYPATRLEVNAVEVRFIAGDTSVANVPEVYKQAMLLLISSWFEERNMLDVQPGRIEAQRDAILQLLASQDPGTEFTWHGTAPAA